MLKRTLASNVGPGLGGGGGGVLALQRSDSPLNPENQQGLGESGVNIKREAKGHLGSGPGFWNSPAWPAFCRRISVCLCVPRFVLHQGDSGWHKFLRLGVICWCVVVDESTLVSWFKRET